MSIARYAPAYWKPPGGRLYERRLAPSAELLQACKHGGLSDAEWKARYLQEIDDLEKLTAAYEAIPDGAVMLCWEGDWNGCHRKLAWERLRDVFGVAGGEWGFAASDQPRPAASRKKKQPSLFN